MKNRIYSLIFSNSSYAISYILILIICSRFLQKDSYGLYRQYFLIYEVASPIVGVGLVQSIHYFYINSNQKIYLLKNVIKIIAVSCIFFSLILLFCYIFKIWVFSKDRLSDHVGATAILYIFFNVTTPIIWGFLLNAGREKISAKINFFYALLLLVCVSIACVFTEKYEIIIYCRLILSGIFFAGTYFYAVNKVRYENNIDVNEYSISGMLKYSIPLGVASGISMLSQQVDKIIISNNFSSEVYASYVNGAMELPLIGIISGSISAASIAPISERIIKYDHIGAIKIIKKSAIVSSIVLFPFACYFFLFSENFIGFIFGNKYSDSHEIFRIYLLLIPIRIIVFGPILMAFGQSKMIMRRAAVELILIYIIGVFLIGYWGPVGAAVSVVFVIYFWSVAYNIYVIKNKFNRKVSEIFPIKEIKNISLVAVVSLFPAYMAANIFDFGGNNGKLLLGSIFYFSTYCLLIKKFLPEYFNLIKEI